MAIEIKSMLFPSEGFIFNEFIMEFIHEKWNVNLVYFRKIVWIYVR